MEEAASSPTPVVFRNHAASCEAVRAALAPAGYLPVDMDDESQIIEQAISGKLAALVIAIEASSEPAHTLLAALQKHECNACVIVTGPDIGGERVAALLRNGASDYVVADGATTRLGQALSEGLKTRETFRRVQALSARLHAVNAELAMERDALRRWNDNLIRLNELGQALASTNAVNEMIDLLAERLRSIVPFDLLGIFRRAPEGLWIRGPRVVEPEAIHRLRQALFARRDDAGAAVLTVREEGEHAVIETPLVSAGRPVGVVRVERWSASGFDRAEVDWLETAITSLALALSNAEARRELEQLVILDGLTNVLNRRGFDAALERELKAATRYRSPVCLVLADLDHFKMVNDRFGHQAGDALLKEVAGLLTHSTRTTDIVTRYGGEEFALLLPRTTPSAGQALAERIRRRIEEHVFVVGGSTVRLTISLGVAGFPEARSTRRQTLVAAADQALYRAKEAGRNTVVLEEVTGLEPSSGSGAEGPGEPLPTVHQGGDA